MFDNFKKKRRQKWEEKQLRLNFTSVNKKDTSETWTALLLDESEARWYKKSRLSYVSEIYTKGPKNTWFFDVIIDGCLITYDFKNIDEAKKQKAFFLNIDQSNWEKFNKDLNNKL
jgi:hypothetical protein